MSRVNFTGRIRLQQRTLSAKGEETADGFVATVRPDLAEFDLEPTADVFVEFYRRTTFVRHHVGTVADVQPVTYHFAEFGRPEGVLVRVKVVSTEAESDGRLLAVGERLRIHWDLPDGQAQSLLPFRSEPGLGSLVWDLELGDEPVVLINAEMPHWNEFARSPHFVALAYPEIVRRIAVWVAGTEPENEGTSFEWARFFEDLTGTPTPYEDEPDDIDQWAKQCAERFADRHAVLRMAKEASDSEED